jgi:hypothetical protein
MDSWMDENLERPKAFAERSEANGMDALHLTPFGSSLMLSPIV